MITKVFSVYDSKAQMFHMPWFAPTTPAGIRSFSDLVNDSQSNVFRHPSDYILYEIGTYDDSNGTVANYPEHKHLGVASQYKEMAGPTPIIDMKQNGVLSEVK